MKTRMVPTHCIVVMTLPNSRTEPRIVKNFLVVVTIEQVRGPKYTTVIKMKVWRRIQNDSDCNLNTQCEEATYRISHYNYTDHIYNEKKNLASCWK